MAFQNPVVSPLTSNQEKLLGQLGSLKNILTVPTKRNLSIPADKQISTFDYLKRIADSTVGAAFIDNILKKFLDEVFNTQSDKLEKIILKATAKSLDSQNKHISNNPNESNEGWLMANAAGPLHVVFQVVKALIVKQIIAMIFGPSTKMAPAYHPSVPMDTDPALNDPNYVLENVVAGESMFSTSNADNNQFGDQEYNLVQLKERLKKGEVIFTISCQDVKIKLPDDFDTQIDQIISNVISSAGTSVGPGSGQVPSPSLAFDYINTHVANETQRINTPENANSIRKSFLEILVDKIFNLLVTALGPYLLTMVNQMNAANPALGLTVGGLIPMPKALKDLHQSDETQFNQKSVFMSAVTNALYALLVSMLLKALIKEIKKLIRNAIAKRAAIRVQSKFKRLSQIRQSLNNATAKLEKAKMAAEALKQFDDIFKFGET